jgi:predicted metalloprotease
MKWRPGKRSKDMEDRRSGGGGVGGGLPGGLPGGGGGGLPIPIGRGGGIGSIILIVIIYLVFGRGLTCGNDGGTDIDTGDQLNPFPDVPAEEQGGAPKGPDAQAQTADFMSFVLDDVQSFWDGEFQAAGKQYQHAKLVIFKGEDTSGCGPASAATGPFYCPLDQTAYLDLGFFNELSNRFKAPGDFPQAYVLAHELGHNVQHVLGIDQKVQEEAAANPDEANDLSVRLELQADCLAGVWARSSYERGILEEGDLDEGTNAASQIGDDRIQEQTQGRIDPESFTHGSAEQRSHWLKEGYDNGKLDACDTFSGDI